MPAHDVGIGTVDFDGLLGDVLAPAGQKEHERGALVEIILHHFARGLRGKDGGVAIARPPAVKPFLHGRIGADVTRRGVAPQMAVAAHDPFASGVDDGRVIAHGNGIHRTAEILGAGGYPALLQTGELRALAVADGVA